MMMARFESLNAGVNTLAFPMIIIREKLLEIWRLGKSFREIFTRRRRVPPLEGVAEGGIFL